MRTHRPIFTVFIMMIFASIILPSSSWAKSKTWTSKSDWLTGIGQNIDLNKFSGDLQIFYDPNKQHFTETRFIYVPNSALNTIVKMDTVTGSILWTYKINSAYGSNPSRTTVDTQGNVWVGLRNGSNVIAISSQGKFLALINVGKGPRAVTVDKDGNIWAGGYNASSITKISGKTFKVLFVVRNGNLCTYGATTDSYGNIWTSDRCRGHVSKITPSGKYMGYVNTPGNYGIASDRRGYVWVASYEGQKAFQIDARQMKVVKTYGLGARGRGVAVDRKGRAWVACSHDSRGRNTRQVNLIDPFTGKVSTFHNVGTHTIGIAVDSKGLVWANSLYEGYAYVLDSNTGRYLRKHPVCDLSGAMTCLTGNGVPTIGCKCSSAGSSRPYTYSDMTGFQLQAIVVPAKATWNVVYDAGCKVKFSHVSWKAKIPIGTQIQVRARTASSKKALQKAFWSPYRNNSQKLGIVDNRFIELQFLMKTKDARVSPALHEATLSFENLPEICDGQDNDCDGQIDEDFPDLGKTCTAGLGVCKNTGHRVCNATKNGTICDAKPLPPQKEICDGLDNNCNGKVDENWDKKGQTCEVGVGACKTKGQWICDSPKKQVVCSATAQTPTPEICDGKDNDCNGKIDDGLTKNCSTQCGKGTQTCQNGQWSACSAQKPVPETCNGQDDDCDGQVDNGLKRPCATICGKGMETCVKGQWAFCDAPKPKPEVCDGKDNDCDGKTDEDIPPKKCQSACGEGVAYCKNGKWSGCSGPQPEPEVCDGKDNDCNGKIDDGLTRSCRSACGEGKEICVSGQWGHCDAPKPKNEICDGKDNDCDGKIDEESGLCPTGMICQNSKCQILCNNGECAKGMKCVDDICVSSSGDPCKNITCDKGEVCVSGRCIDACYTISCPEKQICEKGKCVEKNCYYTDCPDGERCVNGQCEKDPCATVSCSKNSFCREGKCVASCLNVQCDQDERCVDGQCEKDPQKTGDCAGVSCEKGQRCHNGQCEDDPCATVSCPKGRHCVSGVCTHDPCFNIQCPDGAKCIMIDDKAQCVPHKQQPADEKTTSDDETTQTSDGGDTNSDASQSALPDDQQNLDDQDQNPTDGGSIGSKNAADEDDQVSLKRKFSPGGCACHLSHRSPLTPLPLLLLLLLFLPRKKR